MKRFKAPTHMKGVCIVLPKRCVHEWIRSKEIRELGTRGFFFFAKTDILRNMKIVIKLGSAVLVKERDGSIDRRTMVSVVEQVDELMRSTERR